MRIPDAPVGATADQGSASPRDAGAGLTPVDGRVEEAVAVPVGHVELPVPPGVEAAEAADEGVASGRPGAGAPQIAPELGAHVAPHQAGSLDGLIAARVVTVLVDIAARAAARGQGPAASALGADQRVALDPDGRAEQ